MDWEIFLTATAAVFAVIGCNITLFSWLRADIALIKSEAAADRRDLLQIIRCIQEETKDFHGRLCTIEERRAK